MPCLRQRVKRGKLVRVFELDPIQLVWMVNEVGKLRETR